MVEINEESLNAAQAYVEQTRDLGDESVTLRVEFVLKLIEAARKAHALPRQ